MARRWKAEKKIISPNSSSHYTVNAFHRTRSETMLFLISGHCNAASGYFSTHINNDDTYSSFARMAGRKQTISGKKLQWAKMFKKCSRNAICDAHSKAQWSCRCEEFSDAHIRELKEYSLSTLTEILFIYFSTLLKSRNGKKYKSITKLKTVHKALFVQQTLFGELRTSTTGRSKLRYFWHWNVGKMPPQTSLGRSVYVFNLIIDCFKLREAKCNPEPTFLAYICYKIRLKASKCISR